MHEHRPDEADSESQPQSERTDAYELPAFRTLNSDEGEAINGGAEWASQRDMHPDADDFVQEAASTIDLPGDVLADASEQGNNETPVSVVPELVDTTGETADDQVPDFRRRLTFPEARFVELTRAIDRHPDAPVNYVLRGELLVEAGETAAAAEDFASAILLAEKCAESADWGFLSIALMERARVGLQRCKEY
jgi:hypothetical protein